MYMLDNPTVRYLRLQIEARWYRLHNEDRSLGVSAIEWAIITGMLAVIAVIVFGIIRDAITTKANSVSTEGGYSK